MLDKLVASTRSPHGQFTAEKSWPLLQKRIQGGFGWYLWNHRVASLAAVILLCLAGWGIYEYVIPPREQILCCLCGSENDSVARQYGSDAEPLFYADLSGAF